jgi:hypothetical protein
VKGEGFPSGTLVTIFSAASDQLPGTADESERGDGGWRFKLVNPNPVSCLIRAKVDGKGASV